MDEMHFGDELTPKFNDHNNDIGDWCPWSGADADGHGTDDRCPAGCKQSAVVDE